MIGFSGRFFFIILYKNRLLIQIYKVKNIPDRMIVLFRFCWDIASKVSVIWLPFEDISYFMYHEICVEVSWVVPCLNYYKITRDFIPIHNDGPQ